MEITDFKYYDVAFNLEPDILVSLTEVPTATQAGFKSYKRAVNKSINFLDVAIRKRKERFLKKQ
jgi:hypothetical protein